MVSIEVDEYRDWSNVRKAGRQWPNPKISNCLSAAHPLATRIAQLVKRENDMTVTFTPIYNRERVIRGFDCTSIIFATRNKQKIQNILVECLSQNVQVHFVDKTLRLARKIQKSRDQER